MVKRSRVTFSKVKVGDNVTVPIPSVDQGRTDPRNIIGIIIAVSENNMYNIAVRERDVAQSIACPPLKRSVV